ncbi:MAG: MBL fold metallo-hydrolase [Saprospiraceae bacterium]
MPNGSLFEPHGPETLKGSLAEKGLTFEDITDVFLTHLHFDHVGGAVSKNEAGELVPTFPNATYWSNEQHWDWAYTPNAREQASFLKENFVPLKERGQLEMVLPKVRNLQIGCLVYACKRYLATPMP